MFLQVWPGRSTGRDWWAEGPTVQMCPSSQESWPHSLLAQQSGELRATWWKKGSIGCWTPTAAFCCSYPICKPPWVQCWLQFYFCPLSGQVPLPVPLSLGVVGSLVGRIPDVISKNRLFYRHFTHPLARSHSGLETISGVQQPCTGFPVFSLFSLSVCVTSIDFQCFLSKDMLEVCQFTQYFGLPQWKWCF